MSDDKAAPQEPRMVEPVATPELRYCSLRITHEARRMIGTTAMSPHCKSSACTWCLPCFIAKTRKAPA